jgi:hypothetical protein
MLKGKFRMKRSQSSQRDSSVTGRRYHSYGEYPLRKPLFQTVDLK